MATYLTHKMKDLTLFLLQEWNKEQNLQKNKVIIILIKKKKEKTPLPILIKSPKVPNISRCS